MLFVHHTNCNILIQHWSGRFYCMDTFIFKYLIHATWKLSLCITTFILTLSGGNNFHIALKVEFQDLTWLIMKLYYSFFKFSLTEKMQTFLEFIKWVHVFDLLQAFRRRLLEQSNYWTNFVNALLQWHTGNIVFVTTPLFLVNKPNHSFISLYIGSVNFAHKPTFDVTLFTEQKMASK